MSMFEILSHTNKNLKDKPVTLKSKVMVLRLIRNAVSYDNINIQISKSGMIDDSYLIFNMEENKSIYVRVNFKKFFEFVNQPLFSNYNTEDDSNMIDRNSFKEVIDEIKNMLRNKSK